MEMLKYDILIIGAGPAGLSTALHLAQLAPQGATRVLILEKARHPRPKLCAGGLTPDAEILLQRLGLDAGEVPHVDAQAAHFDFAGKGLVIKMGRGSTRMNADAKKEESAFVRARPRPKHLLRIIRRDEFDAWLAGKAREKGIEIREEIIVKDVRLDADGVTVVTDQGKFRARVVVGADGSNGVTRRCALPGAPLHTARLLEVIVPAQPVIARERSDRSNPHLAAEEIASGKSAPRNDTHDGDCATFDFFPIPTGIAGYTWDFPTQVKGQPMRCWGIYDMNLFPHEKRPALKETLAQEMARRGFDLNETEVNAHPLRWFSPFDAFSAPRVLLVGDAAGADGLLGEGISLALGYGLVAARAIRSAFAKDVFSFRDYRRRILRSPLGQTLTARWFFAHILYALRWRRVQALLWRRLSPLIVGLAWLFILNWGKRMR